MQTIFDLQWLWLVIGVVGYFIVALRQINKGKAMMNSRATSDKDFFKGVPLTMAIGILSMVSFVFFIIATVSWLMNNNK